VAQPEPPPSTEQDITAADEPAAPEPKEAVPPLTKSDEARFSSILDDIFKDDPLDAAAESASNYQRGSPDTNPPTRDAEPEIGADTSRTSIPSITDQENPANTPQATEESPFGYELDRKPDQPAAPPPIPARPADAGRDTSSTHDSESPNLSMTDRQTMPGSEIFQPPVTPQQFTSSEFGEDSDGSQGQGRGREYAPRDKIVTPTLGEIYAAQGQYAKAIGVFELLSKKDPSNRHFREKIGYLKKRLQETQDAG